MQINKFETYFYKINILKRDFQMLLNLFISYLLTKYSKRSIYYIENRKQFNIYFFNELK